MKKRVIGILVAIVTMFSFIPIVHAGSLSISASSTNVTPGGSVTVTVKANSLAGKFSITSSSGNVLSGGTSSTWIENESQSFKFTAKSLGSATITVNPIDVGDLSTNGKYTGSKSIKINVVKPREKSDNNNLKSLSIEGYELTPGFNKDTLEYKVELPAEVEKININATKEDGYSSLTGAGEVEVTEGENRIEVTVTSETGKAKKYTIIANVKDNNPIEVDLGKEKLTVVKKSSSLEKLELFAETKVTINEIEVPALYNDKTKITLIGLKNDKGDIQLYIYDKENNTYTKYQAFESAKITVIKKNTKNIPESYKLTTFKIDDKSYEGYLYSPDKKFVLVYGINIETGTEGWYVYNLSDKTLSSYNDSQIPDIEKQFTAKEKNYKMIILALGAFSILSLVIILVLALTRKKKKSTLLDESTEEEVKDKVKKRK